MSETRIVMMNPNIIPERWMRAGIIILSALGLMMLVAGIPVRYDTVMQVCEDSNCARRTLNTEDLSVLQENGWTQQGYAIFQIAAELIYLIFMTPLALFLIRRTTEPFRRMGYLTAYTLFALATVLMPEITLNLAQSHPGWYLLYQVLKGLSWTAFFYFLFTFPNGVFSPDWLRWLLLIPVCVVLLWLITGLPAWDSAEEYGIVASVSLLWVGVIAQFYRYRWRASREERQQTKWLLFGLLLVMLVNFIWVMAFQAFQIQSAEGRVFFNTVGYLLLTTGPVSIAVSLTFAILRYRLWDIDILINRTLVYTILTTVIVLIYITLVNLAGSLLNATLPGSLLATGVIAISFQGLRERIQRSVNRFMFGQRDEPLRVLERLGGQFKTAVTPESLLTNAVNTITSALKIPYAAIYIRHEQEETLQAEQGTSRTPTVGFPLIYQNERVGALVVGQRSPGEALSQADQSVLENIAQQMSAVVHSVRLMTDLRRSRERLVTTREEERRRLRRDLHDGLGPALASQTLKIDAALDLIAVDPAEASALLKEVKAQSQTLVADVRLLVYELRPPALDELGLVAAMTSAVTQLRAAEKGLTITIDVPENLPGLPAAVEVAAYRITMEAITNVIKHAGARECRVRFGITPTNATSPPNLLSASREGAAMWAALTPMHQFQIEIIDDGRGLPNPLTPGVGLNSMRERAEELGGTFSVRGRETGGTHITVILPIHEGAT